MKLTILQRRALQAMADSGPIQGRALWRLGHSSGIMADTEAAGLSICDSQPGIGRTLKGFWRITEAGRTALSQNEGDRK